MPVRPGRGAGAWRSLEIDPAAIDAAFTPEAEADVARLLEDTHQRVTAQWELLQRDLNYYVDPSGVWFALAARLAPNHYLAVSYRSAAGQVGTFPATDAGLVAGQPPRDTLLLIVQPKAGADQGTFRQEMRHIYRVAGADLDLASLKVNLSLNRSEAPLRPGAQATYLSELGLSVPTDPEIFNTPERLFPRSRDPGAALTIRESYIVFPMSSFTGKSVWPSITAFPMGKGERALFG